MEFTYQGLTRHGFGFQNPNHAAALIVLLLPLCWGGRKLSGKWWISLIIWLIEITLYAGLIMTYSRAGILALVCSGTTFAALYFLFISEKKLASDNRFGRLLSKQFLYFCVMALIFLCASFFSGALSRYIGMLSPDRAMTNRLHLWKGALRMFAENPSGVGTGFSGVVYNDFYQLPEHSYTYRTMVNSFLTFLTEQGAVFSLILIFALLCVFFAATRTLRDGRHKAVRITVIALFAAVAGAFISGMSSTCFDLSIWGDEFSLNSFMLTLLSLASTCIIMLLGTLSFLDMKNNLIRPLMLQSLAVSSLVIVFLFALGKYFSSGNDSECRVERTGGVRFAKISTKERSKKDMLVIPDTDIYGNRHLLSFLRSRHADYTYHFPLTPINCRDFQAEKFDAVFLAGRNINFSNANRRDLIFFHPAFPVSVESPRSVRKIYLDEFDETGYNAQWERMFAKDIIEYTD